MKRIRSARPLIGTFIAIFSFVATRNVSAQLARARLARDLLRSLPEADPLTHLPVVSGDGPVVVTIKLSMYSILGLQEESSSMRARIYYSMTFVDESLKWNVKTSGCRGVLLVDRCEHDSRES